MRLLAIVAALGVALTGCGSGSAASATRATPDHSDLVARGRYLVRDAGRCADCHGADLHGRNLSFLKPGLPVMYRSAWIAGLPGTPPDKAIRFFETGVMPEGGYAMAPMPQYRFSRADAEAIVAYLKSIK